MSQAPRPNTDQFTILEYLRTHESLTSFEAIELFHVTRLAACIALLKSQGYEITSTLGVHLKNGKWRKHAIYKLIKED